MTRRQPDELLASTHKQGIGADDDGVRSLSGEACEGRVDIAFAVGRQDKGFDAGRARCGLHISDLGVGRGIAGIGEEPDDIRARDQFAHHSQSFRPECVDDKRHAGDVAAGTAETRNEPEIDRVGAGREHNRNARGCSFGSHCGRRGEGNDRIYGIRHQIGGQLR
jgi:hypothetical protein